MSWLTHLGAGLDRAAARDAQRPDRLGSPVVALAGPGRGPGHGTRSGVGVEGVGLTLGPARLAVRAVHLHNGDALGAQVPGQPGAVGSGAFHPDPLELTVPAQPSQQLTVAGRIGRELPVTELASDLVKHRRMVALAVGVDAARDRAPRRGGHAGHRRTSSARTGWVGTLRSGEADKTVMGASRTGSYEVTPPGRSRANGTTRQADRSRQGQQVRVSFTEGQTQRAVPGTSSLSCGTTPVRHPP